MEFTEEKAQEIVQRHDLPKAYVNKWRFLGRIPDRYEEKTIGRKEKSDAEKLRKVLASDKINITTIAEVAGLERHQLSFFRNGQRDLTPDQVLAIKKEITRLAIDVKKVIAYLEKLPISREMEKKEVRGILNSKRFYIKNTLPEDQESERVKINAFALGKKEEFPAETKDLFLSGLLVLSIELLQF